MMDRASRVFAGSTELTLGGQRLRVRPRVIQDYADTEQHMLAQRFHPDRLARENAHLFADRPDLQDELASIAKREAAGLRNYITRGDIHAWLTTTIEGLCFSIWLSVRDNDPKKYTLDETTRIVRMEIEGVRSKHGEQAAKQRVDELRAPISAASGDDEWAKMDWPLTDDDDNPEQEYRSVPWRSIVRQLGAEYRLSIKEIGQLTFYQLRVLLAGDDEAEGRRVLSPEQLARLKQRRRKQAEASQS